MPKYRLTVTGIYCIEANSKEESFYDQGYIEAERVENV